jgi:hypothetical protein
MVAGCAGQRAADPAEHAAARPPRRPGEVASTGRAAAERLGQGDGGGVEILVHWRGTCIRQPEKRKLRRAAAVWRTSVALLYLIKSLVFLVILTPHDTQLFERPESS